MTFLLMVALYIACGLGTCPLMRNWMGPPDAPWKYAYVVGAWWILIGLYITSKFFDMDSART